MIIGYHFGPGKIYGVSLSLFKPDDLDFEQGSWELISFKILAKLFGLRVVLASLEIADTRASVGLVNCYLSVFWA